MSEAKDQDLVGALFQRISADLGMIIDRPLAFERIETSRIATRAAGENEVHISFKLGFRLQGRDRFGCLLVPLPEAISMAGYLMMATDDVVKTSRSLDDLDRSTKDAILEVSNFVGGAADAVVRNYAEGVSVRSEGCQGVRADVRPAFPYEEGEELILGRARAKLHDFPEFDAVLMIPPLAAA